MKKWNLLIMVVSIALVWVRSDVRAATVTMSMYTEETNVTEWAEAPLYYEEYADQGAWHIGYNEDDPRYDPSYPGYDWDTDEGSIHLDGVLDPDPLMSFGGFVTDFGAPSSFGFIFTMALTPQVSNPSTVQDSFSGSVSNGAANGGVTVTALAPPAGIPVDADGITEMQVFTLFDSVTGTWKNVGLDLGPTTSISLAPFASNIYGFYNEGPIPTVAGGPWTVMRADINFRLTGGGDSFSFNGVKVLVPEPGTVVLTLFGVVGFCLYDRRRAR